MSNMSYCRFQNTLRDLEDCANNMDNLTSLSVDELSACKQLLTLCYELASTHIDEDGNIKSIQPAFNVWQETVDEICNDMGDDLPKIIKDFCADENQQLVAYANKTTAEEFVAQAVRIHEGLVKSLGVAK